MLKGLKRGTPGKFNQQQKGFTQDSLASLNIWNCSQHKHINPSTSMIKPWVLSIT